jgi:hypothetical protein
MSALTRLLRSARLGTRSLQGSVLAVVLWLLFLGLLFVRGVALEVSYLVPALTVAVGGALGGLFFAFVMHLFNPQGGKRGLAWVVCIAVYGVGVWLSLVAGLAVIGLWD